MKPTENRGAGGSRRNPKLQKSISASKFLSLSDQDRTERERDKNFALFRDKRFAL